MSNKNDNWKKEYEDIKSELLMEQVDKAVRKNPKNWRENLEDIGFAWVDDNYDDEEKEEEKTKPINKNQEYLAAYFENHVSFNKKLIDAFIEEAEAEEPNYPLFRKYFKIGNTKLLYLLITGLSKLTYKSSIIVRIELFS